MISISYSCRLRSISWCWDMYWHVFVLWLKSCGTGTGQRVVARQLHLCVSQADISRHSWSACLNSTTVQFFFCYLIVKIWNCRFFWLNWLSHSKRLSTMPWQGYAFQMCNCMSQYFNNIPRHAYGKLSWIWTLEGWKINFYFVTWQMVLLERPKVSFLVRKRKPLSERLNRIKRHIVEGEFLYT